jgi:hypothetical protein
MSMSYRSGMLRRVRTRLVVASVFLGGLCIAAAVIARTMLRRPPRFTPQLDVPLWRGTDLPNPGDPMPTIITTRCTLADPPHVTFTDGQVWLRWDDAGITVRLAPDEAGDLCDQLIDALDRTHPETNQ